MNPGEILQEENLWTTNMNQQRTELAVWRIHRRIGMSGGLLIDALLREIGHRDTKTQAADLAQLHEEAYARRRSQVRVLFSGYTEGIAFSIGNHWPISVGGQGTAMK